MLEKFKEYNEYFDFLKKYGIVSQNGVEIYGIKENLDNKKIPSVIAATKLYGDYDLEDDEIVISFDDFYNCPIVLNKNNEVFLVCLDSRKKIFDSFNEWFKYIKTNYELEL